jgi:hypothetical protein
VLGMMQPKIIYIVGCAHYGDLIWMSQWQFFMYFLNKRKLKKLKLIEIIKKELTCLKLS